MSEEIDKQKIIEAAIFAAGEPVTVDRLAQLFPEEDNLTNKDIKMILEKVNESYASHGVELVQVASGYRFQAKQECAPWLQRLWEKKPPRYTRAFLETLALIAYRQPITRGEIEEVRGVAVNANIIKQLLEREWIKVVGQKDVPGKPALFGTTKEFLDYFNLKKLSELPALEEIADLDAVESQIKEQLNLEVNDKAESATEEATTVSNNIHELEAEPVEEAETEVMLEIDKLIESVG